MVLLVLVSFNASIVLSPASSLCRLYVFSIARSTHQVAVVDAGAADSVAQVVAVAGVAEMEMMAQ
jgi:hypothetical protein